MIEGSLREVALADVLQLLDLGRKSALVRVVHGASAERGTIRLSGGRVVEADVRDRVARERGEMRAAVVELLGWTTGRFCVEPSEEPTSLAAGLSVESVLLDAARESDEWVRLADRLAGPATRLELRAPNAPLATVALSPIEWQVVAYADAALDLRAIAARAQAPVLAVAHAAHRLIGHGLVAVVAVAAVETSVARDGSESSFV